MSSPEHSELIQVIFLKFFCTRIPLLSISNIQFTIQIVSWDTKYKAFHNYAVPITTEKFPFFL